MSEGDRVTPPWQGVGSGMKGTQGMSRRVAGAATGRLPGWSSITSPSPAASTTSPSFGNVLPSMLSSPERASPRQLCSATTVTCSVPAGATFCAVWPGLVVVKRMAQWFVLVFACTIRPCNACAADDENDAVERHTTGDVSLLRIRGANKRIRQVGALFIDNRLRPMQRYSRLW